MLLVTSSFLMSVSHFLCMQVTHVVVGTLICMVFYRFAVTLGNNNINSLGIDGPWSAALSQDQYGLFKHRDTTAPSGSYMLLARGPANYDCSNEILTNWFWQEVWRILYGAPRRHVKPRKDMGKKRPTAIKERTLTHIRRTQRSAADVAARHSNASLDGVQRRAAVRASRVWGPNHDRELAFNDAKRKTDKLRRVSEGVLLPSELAPQDSVDAQVYLEYERAHKKARLRKALNTETRLSYAPPIDHPEGTTVFLEDGCITPGLLPSPQQYCVWKRFKLVDTPVEADICVVERPGHPRYLCTRWALVLKGGWACNHAHFIQKQGGGSCVEYSAAIKTGGGSTGKKPRSIWVSDGFKTKSTTLYHILQLALALPYSRWAEVSMEQFAEETEKNNSGPIRSQRPLQCIGLVRDQQAMKDNKWYYHGSIIRKLKL